MRNIEKIFTGGGNFFTDKKRALINACSVSSANPSFHPGRQSCAYHNPSVKPFLKCRTHSLYILTSITALHFICSYLLSMTLQEGHFHFFFCAFWLILCLCFTSFFSFVVAWLFFWCFSCENACLLYLYDFSCILWIIFRTFASFSWLRANRLCFSSVFLSYLPVFYPMVSSWFFLVFDPLFFSFVRML